MIAASASKGGRSETDVQETTMHLYQRRPPVRSGPPPTRLAQGKCYLARQSLLFFGDDRLTPVEWRRVISWAVTGDRVSVLPTTTRKNRDFLLVDRHRCVLNRPHPGERDSYVCPRVEVLPGEDLIEVGAVPGPTWIMIIQWKRAREGQL
jgi:hypothetical protein